MSSPCRGPHRQAPQELRCQPHASARAVHTHALQQPTDRLLGAAYMCTAVQLHAARSCAHHTPYYNQRGEGVKHLLKYLTPCPTKLKYPDPCPTKLSDNPTKQLARESLAQRLCGMYMYTQSRQRPSLPKLGVCWLGLSWPGLSQLGVCRLVVLEHLAQRQL
jgi:hypothetical protein